MIKMHQKYNLYIQAMKTSQAILSFNHCYNSAQFMHNCGNFFFSFYMFISSPARNRDGWSYAWLYQVPRVNVINVYDHNAESQLRAVITSLWLESGAIARLGIHYRQCLSAWVCVCVTEEQTLTHTTVVPYSRLRATAWTIFVVDI